jgi:pSer/pThr/pTyr-binding forkhead associated (FHA) protein
MLAHLCENSQYQSALERDQVTMNYVLQVVRGRSATTTLKLADGVTSLGRHDDCIVRIKSSQVSRRHCEIHDVDGKLMVRDLGSSNGTFVNGKRVLGQQNLKVGDELTVGSVTLRVATLGQPVAAPHRPAGKPGDTAVVEAVAIDAEEEFEIEFDEGEPEGLAAIEAIPLAEIDETPASAAPKKTPAAAETPTAKPAANKGEDQAVAEFLLDLDLDDE